MQVIPVLEDRGLVVAVLVVVEEVYQLVELASNKQEDLVVLAYLQTVD
jgi:hypothetical protein